MTDEEFQSLIDDFENENIEFRTEITRGDRDARNVGSFFNTSGGKLVYGIKQEGTTREIVGVGDPQVLESNLMNQLRAACPECDPKFEFKKTFEGICVIVHCHRGANPPYKVNGTVYVRRGSNSIEATPEEVTALYRDSSADTYDKRVIDNATIDDLDQKFLKDFLIRTSAYPIEDGDFESIISRSGYIRKEKEVPKPSIAALLLFGKNPQLSLLHAKIKADAKKDIESTEWVDLAELEGTLFDQIRDAEVFLKRNLKVSARIIGFERVEMPQLPPEALREAIINAIVHRDYSKTGSEISLHIVGGKVIIQSPGRLLAPLTVEAILAGDFNPSTRNPVIAHVLDKAGLMDKRGSGILRMRKLMSEFNLNLPVFEELEDAFRVTFDSTPIKEDDRTLIIPTEILAKANLDFEQKKILRLIEQKMEVTTVECEEAIHKSKPPTLKRLKSLIEAGLIESTGQNPNDPNMKYRLHKKFVEKESVAKRPKSEKSTTQPLF